MAAAAQLLQLVHFARSYSPFFSRLYKDLDLKDTDAVIKNVPVVDHTLYWASNDLGSSEVMTGPQIDGVVLRTGGLPCFLTLEKT